MTVEEVVIAEMRVLARVAGQASVEGYDLDRAQADARFAEYATRWADALEAAQRAGWQPIETAPRDSSHIIVYVPRHEPDRQAVMEAWWAIPYEAAPAEKGWWQTMGGVCLSADVHDGLGATHWMPLPASPTEQRCRRCGASQAAHCDLDEPGLDHPATCDKMHHEFKEQR